MQIRVDCKGAEHFFVLKKKNIVGASPSSDIPLEFKGISRLHAEIMEDNGSWYVIDKGSTNGTFINDEKLTPNQKVPFNSFFPLRLGFDVYIFLVDEVESQGANLNLPTESTRPVQTGSEQTKARAAPKNNVKEFLHERKKEANVGKKKSTLKEHLDEKKDQGFVGLLIRFSILATLLILGFTHEKWIPKFFPPSEEELKALKNAKVEIKNSAEILPEAPPPPPPPPPPPVSDSEVESAFRQPRCFSQTEIEFCTVMKDFIPRSGAEGAYIFADTLFIFYDIATTATHFAQNQPYSDREKQIFIEDVKKRWARIAGNPIFEQTLKLKDLPWDKVPVVLGVYEILFSGIRNLLEKHQQILKVAAVPILFDQEKQTAPGKAFVMKSSEIQLASVQMISFPLKKGIISGDTEELETLLKDLSTRVQTENKP